jgi:acetyl-CoA acetyltransferase
MTLADAFICDAVRTPFGRYAGALSSVRADDLAAIPPKALLVRNPLLETVVSTIQRFGSQLGTSDWIPAELLMRLWSRGQRFADYDNATITGLTRETATT